MRDTTVAHRQVKPLPKLRTPVYLRKVVGVNSRNAWNSRSRARARPAICDLARAAVCRGARWSFKALPLEGERGEGII